MPSRDSNSWSEDPALAWIFFSRFQNGPGFSLGFSTFCQGESMSKDAHVRIKCFKSIPACGLILGLGFVFSQSANAAPQATAYMVGTVRDFTSSHPDFGQDTGIGYGHVAGNVGLAQSASGKPLLAGVGYLVNTQWRDRSASAIAPHLYSNGAGMLQLVMTPNLSGHPTFDTYDSADGPYGGANVGSTPGVQTGATMPTITVPTGLPPLIDEAVYSGNGNSTIAADIHCNKFEIKNNHTVTISGDVTIMCEQDFLVNNHGSIIIPDGSSLTVYARDKIEFTNNVDINLSSPDHSKLVIYNLGFREVRLWNHASIYAEIISPFAQFHGTNNTDFYGTIEALTIQLDNSAGLHLDLAGSVDACNTLLSDTAGSAGSASTANVTSSTTFNEWFTEVLGTNLALNHSITLTRNASGVYEYIDNSFYPINDRLFGNEGAPNNGNFTFEATFSFVYASCGSQFFEVSGADDMYLFIDGQLVIDLGGLLHGQSQKIEFDRLGLINGNTYQLRFFYANRHTYSSEMNLRTNVEIDMPTITQVASGSYD